MGQKWTAKQKKTGVPLKNKASRFLHNHSNSIMAKCFLLYIVAVLTLRVLHLYIFHTFYFVFELFLPNFCPVITKRFVHCLRTHLCLVSFFVSYNNSCLQDESCLSLSEDNCSSALMKVRYLYRLYIQPHFRLFTPICAHGSALIGDCPAG